MIARLLPRLGQARRLHAAGHRLHERVVDGVAQLEVGGERACGRHEKNDEQGDEHPGLADVCERHATNSRTRRDRNQPHAVVRRANPSLAARPTEAHFGGLASRCADQEKPRGGHREREDGAAPKRGEDRCIFPSFAPSIANGLHEGAGDEWGNDQAQAWKPTWRQKSVWKNECADDATNRTDDSPAQYCEDWIRLACATERMREAFPAKGECEITERLDGEFEEQLKKNIDNSSSL